MAANSDGDLPPSYSPLILSPADLTIIKTTNVTETFLYKSIEDNNARVAFSRKVLHTFFLQTIAVDLTMELFIYLYIFNQPLHITPHLVILSVLSSVSLFLMLPGFKARREPIYNHLLLVYQPCALTAIAILIMRVAIEGDFGQEMLETIAIAWKSCVISGPAILVYSLICPDSKQAMSLVCNIFIASGVFVASYTWAECWYGHTYIFVSAPATVFLIYISFYFIYLYILYDINAMTSKDYRLKITPSDYVNGAVNLQFDFIFIFIRFLKRCFCRSRQTSVSVISA